MLYYMNWLTYDFWTGGWEFDRSHGAGGTSSPTHWQKVEEQQPKTCGLDDMLPPDDLCSRPEALC